MYIGRRAYQEPIKLFPKLYINDKLLPSNIFDFEYEKEYDEFGYPTFQMDCRIKSKDNEIDFHFYRFYHTDENGDIHLYLDEDDIKPLLNKLP